MPSMPSSSPSVPNPTAQRNAPSGQPSSPKSGQASPSSPGGKDQQEAAEQLKTAGQQVAEAGQELPPMTQQPATAGEWDPLIPDSEKASQSESDVLSDDVAESGRAESSDAMMMPEAAGGPAGDPPSSDVEVALAKEIQAAQEALENAGITLQRAGEILETAKTAEELADAEAALARARVAVILAGQDLLDLQEVMQGSDNEHLIQEAQETLNEANVAIVVATDSIFSSRIELPEFDSQQAQGAGVGSGRESELEKELNDSIIVFENEILEARAEVIGSAPPPTSRDNVPGVVVLGGNVQDDAETFEENTGDPIIIGDPKVTQQGRMPEGADIAAVEDRVSPLIPDDVPDPQGDDIVAQQLREAAIAETDPDLRDKLWEEYKRYKAGL